MPEEAFPQSKIAPLIQERAKELRRKQTDTEIKLWQQLRGRRFVGHKFRRQVPLGTFIVDFVCFERKLIIELDGGQHNPANEYEVQRRRWLEQGGFRLVRFWDNEVFENLEGVLQVILNALSERDVSPSPSPSPIKGEESRKLS